MNPTITQAAGREKAKGFPGLRAALAAFLVCWAAPAAAEDATPLVFIHGIKGSELLSDKGSVEWVTATQALSLSTPDLSLEARFEDGRQPLGPLLPGKILARINILPLLVGVDIYGPWLKVAGSWEKPFYQFSYDWRRDNLETMATFAKFLESVKARHGGRKVQVVGHSMGGMIALAVMNRNPELIDRIVFAGSPFGGGIGFLTDLHQGTDTGLNSKIVGPDVVKTFPSVFSFFPETPGNLLTTDLEVQSVDFFKAEDWKRAKIGMYAGTRDPGDGYTTFLTEALGRAKRFRQLLQPDPSRGGNPPVLVVAGKSFKTLTQAIWGGPKQELGWDFETAAKVPGDGRVAYVNAMPPEGVKYDVFESKVDHTDLLNDPRVQKAIEGFLK